MLPPTSPQGWPAPPPDEPPSRDWSGIEPLSFAWGLIKADLLGVVAPLFAAGLVMLVPPTIFSGLQVAGQRVAGA